MPLPSKLTIRGLGKRSKSMSANPDPSRPVESRFAGTETRESDVMGKSLRLTANQGSESEEEGSRACEMDLKGKSLLEKERSALVANDQHLEPGKVGRIRRWEGERMPYVVIRRFMEPQRGRAMKDLTRPEPGSVAVVVAKRRGGGPPSSFVALRRTNRC